MLKPVRPHVLLVVVLSAVIISIVAIGAVAAVRDRDTPSSQRGVLSVSDADIAVSYGPGLRWGVMGQSLQWHLGGGAGGISHFMDHLMDPLAGMMKALGTPDITPDLKRTIVEGVLKEAGPRSVEQLAHEENELLVGLLRLRAQQRAS